MSVKLCIDCKWIKEDIYARITSPFAHRFARCSNPLFKGFSKEQLVAGTGGHSYCENQRDYECGVEGKGWEEK